MTTPRDQGYRMPHEGDPHARTWMAWPCREALWGNRLEGARRATAEVAAAIAAFEPVTVIARPELGASVSLHTGARVAVLPMPQDDSWARDSGPTFVVRPAAPASAGVPEAALAGIDWNFNGWGQAWPDHNQDAQMAGRLLQQLSLPCFRAPIVLEGGGLHVDGHGTALVCETSVLDPLRNPGLDRSGVGQALADFAGVERVIWLAQGLVGDETRGHIDNLACFGPPGVVVAAATEDRGDENWILLAENLDTLRAARDAGGRPFDVVTLPLPQPQTDDLGARLTLSYINYYLVNGGVVMPAFGDPADDLAYATLVRLFPNRRVVQVEVGDLLHGGGGIHCITQQQPAI